MPASRFGQLLGKTRKVNNHPKSEADKAEIRLFVLECVPDAVVLDAFAGSGVMYQRVWHKASEYIGCDRIWYPDDRLVYACDSRRLLRALDLQRFNVFDLDSYGSPWEHVVILAARRTASPGEKIGVCLTEGSGINLKFGGLPSALGQLTGIVGRVPGAFRARGHLINRALDAMAKRMRAKIIKRWQAEPKRDARMVYIGVVLEGLPAS